MSTVAVAMTTYNDVEFLPRAIESVLSQTFRDFDLYIFDNYSPDPAVAKVLQHYADSDKRVHIVELPQGLAGIGVMSYWWEFLRLLDQKYTITLGGHDCWNQAEFLEILVTRMEETLPAYATVNKTVSLIYPDTWQVNQQDQIVGKYQTFWQFASEIPEHIKALSAIATVNSPQLFGLWNEAVRRQLPMRHKCSGWDHLVVTEAALYGHILYEPQAQLVMRTPKPSDNLELYGKRHLTDEQRAAGPKDFYQQLDWLRASLMRGVEGLPASQRENYAKLVCGAAAGLYMALRGHNLLIVPGAMQEFMKDPHAQRMLSGVYVAAEEFVQLADRA